MPEVEIRPAVRSDLPYLVTIEHAYQSQHVWQMDRLIEDGQVVINFRQTRLPRPVRVEPGPTPLLNEENWSRYQALLVAMLDQVLVGYIGLSDQLAPKTIWVTDCAVSEDQRRKGNRKDEEEQHEDLHGGEEAVLESDRHVLRFHH